jgi:hypothetical protein
MKSRLKKIFENGIINRGIKEKTITRKIENIKRK